MTEGQGSIRSGVGNCSAFMMCKQKNRWRKCTYHDIIGAFDESETLNLTEVVRMNEQVKECIEKYSSEIIDMFNDLRKLIFDSVSCEPEETLWAKLPSYYVGESFV